MKSELEKFNDELKKFNDECNKLYAKHKPKPKTDYTEVYNILWYIPLIFLAILGTSLIFMSDAEAVETNNTVIQNYNNTLQPINIFDTKHEQNVVIKCEPVSPSATSCYTNCGVYFWGYQEITAEQYKDNCNSLREWREI